MFLRPIRYLLILAICLCLCLFFIAIHISHTLAAINPIAVSNQAYTISFPKSIDFQISATDTTSSITMGTIFIKDSSTAKNTSQFVDITAPARTLTLHSSDDISGSNFASPGTQITYYWKLQDAQGNTHTSPVQTLSVIDTRFSWQHINQGKLQVNWYDRSTDFGQTILSQASASLNRIASNLGGNPGHPLNLWIYKTTNDFHGALPPGTYEWVGGVAFPKLDQASVVVQSPNDLTLIRDMPHELTHLLFHQLGGQNSIYTPTWFDEGLAVYNQAYHEAAMKQTFQQALKDHSLLRLNDIKTGFPADADKAYLAYSQSWNLVNYMYMTFGEAKIAALIKALNNPALDFNTDFEHTFGIDQDHLENQWRLSLQQPAILSLNQTPYQPLENTASVHVASDPYAPILLLLGIFLLVMPIIGLGGLFRYQRRISLSSQAQAIINSTLPSYSRQPEMKRDNPNTIPAPYPAYPAYPPRVLPDTPNKQSPVNPYHVEKGWPPVFPPGQDYNNQRPDRQRRQE